jgi:hypothetical protein
MQSTSTILGAGVAVIGGVLLLRHYIQLVAEPFRKCVGVRDFLWHLATMDDARFLGVLMGALLIILYILEIIYPQMSGLVIAR